MLPLEKSNALTKAPWEEAAAISMSRHAGFDLSMHFGWHRIVLRHVIAGLTIPLGASAKCSRG